MVTNPNYNLQISKEIILVPFVFDTFFSILLNVKCRRFQIEKIDNFSVL